MLRGDGDFGGGSVARIDHGERHPGERRRLGRRRRGVARLDRRASPPPGRSGTDDRRRAAARRLQRLAPTARLAAGTFPARSPSRASGCDRVEAAEIQRLLRVEGRHPRARVVVYGDARTRSGRCDAACELGQGGVRVYEDGWTEWAADERLPVERLPNYDKLVHTDWLRELLDGGQARGRAPGALPPLPRELRRPRGVRGEPPPRRALPRHQLAGEPGRLEPAHRRRSSRPRCARSASPTTRR